MAKAVAMARIWQGLALKSGRTCPHFRDFSSMLLAQGAPDLRRHKRIRAAASARISIAGAWHDCWISNISGGGAFIEVQAQVEVEAGDAVVLITKELGPLVATVQRLGQNGLSLTFGVAENAREELINRLTAYLNTHLLS